MSRLGDPVIASLITAAVTLFGLWVTRRVTMRAHAGQHEVSLSAEAREWVADARQEAAAAKTEAREAKAEAAAAEKTSKSAERRADDAERRIRAVNDQISDLVEWIARVVRHAQAVDPTVVDDPQVQRLLAVINGGPASLSQTRLPTEH